MNSLKLSLIKFITFFSYSGFYAGLVILLSIGFSEDQSRLFSIPIRLLLCLLMFTFIFLNLFNKKQRIFIPEALIIIFWIIYALKILWVHSVGDEVLNKHWSEYIFYTIAYCILPYFTFRTVNMEQHGDAILSMFISSGFIMSISGTYVYGSLLLAGVSRINNAANMGFDLQVLSPHILSYTASLTIGLSIYKLTFREQKYNQKLFLWCVIILSFIMFLLGASRGSVFALGFSSLLFFRFGTPKIRLRFFMALAIIVPIVIFVAIRSGSEVFTSVLNIQEDIASQSDSAIRLLLWYNSFFEFVANPLFGGAIQVNGTYPHNFILEVLMVTGLVGFLFYIPIIISGFHRGMKLANKHPQYIWLMVIFVQGLFQHMFSGSINEAILLFIPLGLIYASKKNTTPKSNRIIK